MDMKQHVTVVGAIHIGFGVLGLIVASIVLVVLIGTGILVLSIEGDELPLTILASVAVFITILVAIFSVPEIIGGIGVLKYKNWARYLTLIVAVFNLFNIPVGTIVGVYTFWVLMQDEVESLFTADSGAVED